MTGIAVGTAAYRGSGYAVVTPTVPIEPPPLGYLAPNLGRETIVERMQTLAGFTPIHNIAGLPAMSVPLYWSPTGLPIGIHFTSGLGQDQLLFELAYQLEEACPWSHRRPRAPETAG